MSSRVIDFPSERTSKFQQDQTEAVLMEDPNFRFIFDLLTAVSEIGLPIDGTPSRKAREIYASCLRENVFVNTHPELSKK